MNHVLLNTLFVGTPGAVLHLEGDTVRVSADGNHLLNAPLLHLGAVVAFGGVTVSGPLMMRCATDGREVVYLDGRGRFKARVVGPTCGNVMLRKAQYEAAVDPARALTIAKWFVAAKVRNSRQLLQRAARDAGQREDREALKAAVQAMAELLEAAPGATTLDELRGVEGRAAAAYFGVFGRLITRPKSEFAFATRTRRPPRDRTNALLSLLYSILKNDCVGACDAAGLDPQFGYLHALRSGRPALALDLMEEFRAAFVDRLVISLINRRQVQPQHFLEQTGESVMLTDAGRKVVLTEYQRYRQEEVEHPEATSKVPRGLIPHLQARLLARYLRGDTEGYTPYIVR